jgi:hypothetical protein
MCSKVSTQGYGTRPTVHTLLERNGNIYNTITDPNLSNITRKGLENGSMFSLVKIEENCSFKSSAFSDASAYVFPSFFNGATPEPSHFLLLINEYRFLLLVPLNIYNTITDPNLSNITRKGLENGSCNTDF